MTKLLKTIICTVVLGLLVAVPAFSQIRVGGWGRMVWVPIFINSEGEARSVMHVPWGEEGAMEFSLHGASENIGFDFNFTVGHGEGTVGLRDVNQIGIAQVWWRPNPMFRMIFGMGRSTSLRGIEATSGSYPYARGRLTGHTTGENLPLSGRTPDDPFVRIDDGDGIFSRFNLDTMGAILELTPLPGLFVGVAFAPGFNQGGGHPVEDVFRGLHAAVGYTIPGVGLFRVGYVGPGQGLAANIANAGANTDFSFDERIEAAFRLNMVHNLVMDIGFKWSMEERPGTIGAGGFSLQNPLYIAMAAIYTGVRDLRIGLAVDGHFAGDAPDISAPQIAFNLFPSYELGGGLSVGMDFTFGMQLGDIAGVNDRQMLGFGAFIQRAYGNGNVRLGVFANAPMVDGQEWGMSLPVWITYSF